MSNNVMENVQANTNIAEVKEKSLLDKKRVVYKFKERSRYINCQFSFSRIITIIAIISVLIKIDSKGKVFTSKQEQVKMENTLQFISLEQWFQMQIILVNILLKNKWKNTKLTINQTMTLDKQKWENTQKNKLR